MEKVRIKQIKSGIDMPLRQKRTLQALGLKRMQQVVEHVATPQIMGMVKKIAHLVTIEKVD